VVLTLSDAQLGRLAEMVAERLQPTTPPQSGAQSDRVAPLVSARALATRLGVDPKSVYRHAPELGGVRVGRAWRFDLERATAAWANGASDRHRSERSQAPEPPVDTGSTRRQRRPSKAPECQLMPVGRAQGAGEG
jgi:hypothetical protein